MKLVSTFILGISLTLSSSVWAHVGLSSSNPVKGAMLNESPSKLELTYSAPVRLVKVSLQNAQNKSIALTLPGIVKPQSHYSFALPVLAASSYTVSWMTMGKDGHKMKGKFNFMVHGSGATSSPENKNDVDSSHQ